MNNKSKIIYSILVFLFAFSFNSGVVNAYFTDKSEEKVNTFTIAELKEVTYEYYYLDENDTEVEVQSSNSDNVFVGTQVSINDTLTNLDCSSIKHYVNGNLYNGNTYVVNDNTTIKEVCELNRYTITYNLDGGTLDNPKNTYTSMTPTFDLTTPTKSGYTFLGWGNETVVSGSSGVVSIATEMENGTVYDLGTQGSNHIYLRTTSGTGYAMNVDYNGSDRVMVFTDDSSSVVQYSTNGTSWNTISNWNSSNGIYYQYFTLSNGGFNSTPDINDPGMTYDQFTSVVSGGTITLTNTVNPYTVTQGSTGDIEVTAQWRANQTYTVTFNKNSNRAGGSMDSQTFVSGESQKLNPNTFTGYTYWGRTYTFQGWATSSTGSVVYTDEQEITVTENMTLYAKWG